MRRGKPNDRKPPVSLDSVLAKREGRLRCRDCREYTARPRAINESQRRFRCPLCGGIMDRDHDDWPSQTAAELTREKLTEIIRRAIDNRGLNVDELSNAAGVPYRVLRDLIAGECDLHINTAAKLCRFLKIELRPPSDASR